MTPIPIYRSLMWMLLLQALCVSGCGTADPTELAMERGQAFLRGIQRPDGAISDTLNPLFEAWETVEAAWALSQDESFSADSSFWKAMNFLAKAENSQQLICHNLSCQSSTCIETSSEYLALILRTKPPTAIQEPLEVLAGMQLPEGNWVIGNPDVLSDTAFPSVTGFALNIFRESESFRGIRLGGEQWLVKNQLPEGHWGQSWEYYGCNAYALWANLRAMKTSVSEVEGSIQMAKEYILQSQLPNGSWDDAGESQRKVTPALQTALMLAALDPDGTDRELAAAEKGLEYLLTQQRADGSWDGGFFPIPHRRYQKEEYVFATARAVMALAKWHRK